MPCAIANVLFSYSAWGPTPTRLSARRRQPPHFALLRSAEAPAKADASLGPQALIFYLRRQLVYPPKLASSSRAKAGTGHEPPASVQVLDQ